MTKARERKPPARRKKAAAPPPAAPVDPITATMWVEPPPAVSRPGGPSAHPDRPPVPARPSLVNAILGPNLLGRPTSGLQQYREPPTTEGGAEIDMCAGCDVDCCTGHYIPVNLHDAWRIRSVLNIPYREFLGLVPYEGASPTHSVRIGRDKYQLILKRREDRGCGFLVRMGAQRRCGIHALRPDACRIFPYLPDLELQTAQEGHALVQMHPSHCPWQWPATPEHKARVLHDIRENQEHRKFDRDILSRWHWVMNVERTVENFFQFLEEEIPRVLHRPDEKSRYVSTLW